MFADAAADPGTWTAMYSPKDGRTYETAVPGYSRDKQTGYIVLALARSMQVLLLLRTESLNSDFELFIAPGGKNAGGGG